jgi:hypothetical protein
VIAFLHSLRRMSWHFIVLLLGNAPGIPNNIRAAYFRLALAGICQLHPDVPYIVQNINRLERA